MKCQWLKFIFLTGFYLFEIILKNDILNLGHKVSNKSKVEHKKKKKKKKEKKRKKKKNKQSIIALEKY